MPTNIVESQMFHEYKLIVSVTRIATPVTNLRSTTASTGENENGAKRLK
jgi:hypothetical protein